MTVSLSILDRILVLGCLPAENNVLTLKVIKKLKENIGFNEEEMKLWNIQEKDGRILWNNQAPSKDFEIGEKSIEIIADSLKQLSDQKKLTEQHLRIYEKFVESQKE
jgi:hypothetical protein